MKRYGGLFVQLTDFGHLLKAFYRAYSGSRHNPAAHAWFFHLEKGLLGLKLELENGLYMPSPYRYFKIYDPKEREISVAAFKDRIVHHAVVMLLEPIYERTFIFDSYATRKNKGVHAARARAQAFTRRYPWFLKADMDGYFASIRHEVLVSLLERKVKDAAFVGLCRQIIANGGRDGVGLPIGNLTSQFLANVYLDPFDHWVKETLRVEGYLRYMDDFVLFAADCGEAKWLRSEVSRWLQDRLSLRLKSKATFINRRENGLRFLGGRIFPDTIRIHRDHLKRFLRRLRHLSGELEAGFIKEEAWLRSLESRWAYLSSFDSLELRKNLLRKWKW